MTTKQTTKKTNTQTAQKQIKMAEFYTLEPGSPYDAVRKDRTLFRGLTIAALVATGFCKLTKTGMVAHKVMPKGNLPALRGIIGKSASNQWINTTKRIDAETGKLTESGKREVAASFARDKGYRTTTAIVNAMIPAIKKGGKVTVEGENHGKRELNFRSTIKVKA